MTTENDVAFAAQELALIDEGRITDSGAGKNVLKLMRDALLRGKVSVDNVKEEEGRDVSFLRFTIKGQPLEIVFGHKHPHVWRVLTIDPTWGKATARLDVPLVYDPSTQTFVGTELDRDIALAAGEYPPRKSAMRVILESIQKVLDGTK